jgi:hypothetical protein
MNEEYEHVVYKIGGVFLPAGMYSAEELENLAAAVREKERLEHEALQRSIKAIKMEFKGFTCN